MINFKSAASFATTSVLSAFALSTQVAQASDPQPAANPRTPLRVQIMMRGAHRVQLRTPAASPTSASTAPNFTFFDMPSSTDTEAAALNLGVGGVASHVVGCYVPNNSTSGLYDGFEYTLTTHSAKKSSATLDVIGATNVGLCPYAINDSGVVVGAYLPATGLGNGFVLDGTTVTQLIAPYPNVCITFATSVNDAGTVVGEYEMNSDCTAEDGWSEAGFIWSNGTFSQAQTYPGSIDSTVSGINSAGDMVGGALNGTETADIGWLLKGGVFTVINYPGLVFTEPLAVNDSDEIVGYYCAQSFDDCQDAGPYLGFLYKNGTYTTIAVPGMPVTYLYGINNKGEISGEYEDTNGYWHSFLVKP
jgi:uncharacterized membrane protein